LDSNAAALYNRACAESLLSAAAAEAGSGLTDAEGRAAADKAMDTLRRCVAAGWRDAGYMLLDTALTPIRSRPDFQSLVMDLGFPADPFAR
jgi:eukaryotic-like serine/threonine-protein kinase